MNRIRQFSIIILVVIPVAILVMIRMFSTDHFRPNALKLTEPSFSHANLMTWEQGASLTSEKLIVDLSDNDGLRSNQQKGLVHIPVRSLLVKANLKIIRMHKGPVLLYSVEPGISARAWMILSQMGYRQVYILTGDTDNEVMKYQFKPEPSGQEPLIK